MCKEAVIDWSHRNGNVGFCGVRLNDPAELRRLSDWLWTGWFVPSVIYDWCPISLWFDFCCSETFMRSVILHTFFARTKRQYSPACPSKAENAEQILHTFCESKKKGGLSPYIMPTKACDFTHSETVRRRKIISTYGFYGIGLILNENWKIFNERNDDYVNR